MYIESISIILNIYSNFKISKVNYYVFEITGHPHGIQQNLNSHGIRHIMKSSLIIYQQ